MGIRIVLVGLVAGLGLSLPSAKQLGVWQGSARAWVDARLADWDARMPVDEEAFVVAADPAWSRVEVSENPALAAEIAAPVTTPEPAAPTVATPSQAELATGLDLPTRPMDFDQPETVASTTPTPAAPAPVTDPGFDAAQDEFVAGLTTDQAPAVPTARSERTGSETLVRDDAEALDADADLYQGLAYELNRGSEGLEITAPAPAPTPSVAVRDVPRAVEPDAAENLYAGLAYELNRAAEGLDPTPVSGAVMAGAAKPSDREGRLTTAVRLTRDAVYAWSNLLHGPAVVTIER